VQIFNNQAPIVCEQKMPHLFESAEQWCEEAAGVRFPYPKNLLLHLKLSRSPFPDLETVIAAHQSRFHARQEVLPRADESLGSTRPSRRALTTAARLNGA